MPEIRLTVNGRQERLTVKNSTLLVNALRDQLGLTGAREACGVGICGACTVIVNRRTVSSCLSLAVLADGAEVLTVEGLSDGDRLHPLQQAFLEAGAFQCGYCTPGFLMSGVALLATAEDPSEEEVRHFLVGNLCRCTSYQEILSAVMKMKEQASPDWLQPRGGLSARPPA
ncbi:MAG: (2Fe-2S)-binding protein [Candidatus Tectomicrobia bacterium]|nr:(2Fe-2S)-binding protein [Candidatus Tectomicrobia bacterium]